MIRAVVAVRQLAVRQGRGFHASAPAFAAKKIAVLSGDGIGPEVMGEAIKVLDAITEVRVDEDCPAILPHPRLCSARTRYG
jgi:hypothetical protein